MTLAQDAKPGFRVEGLFELDLGGQGGQSDHLACVVAGAGFEPATCGL